MQFVIVDVNWACIRYCAQSARVKGIQALPQIPAIRPIRKADLITRNSGRPIVEASIAGGTKGNFLMLVLPTNVEVFMRKLLAFWGERQ